MCGRVPCFLFLEHASREHVYALRTGHAGSIGSLTPAMPAWEQNKDALPMP
jgi:hypothetical protein